MSEVVGLYVSSSFIIPLKNVSHVYWTDVDGGATTVDNAAFLRIIMSSGFENERIILLKKGEEKPFLQALSLYYETRGT